MGQNSEVPHAAMLLFNSLTESGVFYRKKVIIGLQRESMAHVICNASKKRDLMRGRNVLARMKRNVGERMANETCEQLSLRKH
jgi:hypothetical protein